MSDMVTILEMLKPISLMALFGGFGQGIRAFSALLVLRLKEAEAWKVDWVYSGMTVLGGCMVGIVVGVILKTTDPLIIIPFGYAGMDAAEKLLKNRIEERGVKKL